jgi:hypothetical protein
MTGSRESIEHLGDVSTFVLDLEARWQVESGARRLGGEGGRSLLDLTVDVRADSSQAWSHLTSPGLRPLWEGPIVIEEVSIGGRRGVGTSSQCVTGRLATLEEIVDWQPFDHAGWRLAVPEVGPVDATLDLDPIDEGTRAHLRWTVPADLTLDPGLVARLASDKAEALQRLAGLFEKGLATVSPKEGSA